MDIDKFLESGTIGIIGLLVFILYKVLAHRFPIMNGGGHSKRAADTLETMNESLQEMVRTNKDITEVLTGQGAKRPNQTLKVHSDPDRETEIHETNETAKAVLRIVKNVDKNLEEKLREADQNRRIETLTEVVNRLKDRETEGTG